jgi:hypothetical protein
MKSSIMKSIKFLLIPIAALFIFQSCGKVDAAEGKQTATSFDVPDFDKIRIETAGVVNFTQNDVTHVEVFTNEKILDILKVEVVDNTLIISYSKNKTIVNAESILFTISDDNVYSIETTGSANINADFDEGYDFASIELISAGSGNINMDAINAGKADINTSGSGNINVQTVDISNRLVVSESGSGDVSIDGSCEELDLNLSGSGNFGEYDFISQKVIASISGSGSAELYVNYDLNASLSGSGNLTYKGHLTLKAISSSGSGEVIDGN